MWVLTQVGVCCYILSRGEWLHVVSVGQVLAWLPRKQGTSGSSHGQAKTFSKSWDFKLLLHTLYRDVTACISNVVCGDTSVNAIAGVASGGPRTQVGVCSYILSIGKWLHVVSVGQLLAWLPRKQGTSGSSHGLAKTFSKSWDFKLLLHTLYRDVTACISNVVCDDTSVNAIAGVVVASVGPHTGWCLLLHTL